MTTKIFSTPKEVEKVVSTIPLDDMEQIEEILRSFKGDQLMLPKSLVKSNSVLKELDRAGWVIENYASCYHVYPKKWRFQKFYKQDSVVLILSLSLMTFVGFIHFLWDHCLRESVIMGIFFLFLYFCSIAATRVDR